MNAEQSFKYSRCAWLSEEPTRHLEENVGAGGDQDQLIYQNKNIDRLGPNFSLAKMPEDNGAGPINLPVEFKSYSQDDADSPLKIILVNDVASY